MLNQVSRLAFQLDMNMNIIARRPLFSLITITEAEKQNRLFSHRRGRRRKKEPSLSLRLYPTIWSFLSKNAKIAALIGDGNDRVASAAIAQWSNLAVASVSLSFLWHRAKIIPIPPPWSIHIHRPSNAALSTYPSRS